MFIEHNFEQIRAMMTYAHEHSEAERRQGEGESGFDFRYFVNCSNALFIKAENVRQLIISTQEIPQQQPLKCASSSRSALYLGLPS